MSDLVSIEADVLRCGYEVGYFDEADIVSWADRQITLADNPSTTLLDLSMSRQTNPVDLLRLLKSLGSWHVPAIVSTKIGFIGLLVCEKHVTIQAALSSLWAVKDDPAVTFEQQSRIYSVAYYYDLAESGIQAPLAEAEQELREFVTPYAKQLLSKHSGFILALRPKILDK
jgi:hypothetical protein